MSFSSEQSSRPASTLPRQDTATTMSSFSTSCSNLDTVESLSNTSSLRRHKTKPGNKKRRKSVDHFTGFGDERTLRTLKVHYYPEGDWGWIVIVVGVAIQTISHGLHMAYGMFLVKLENVFGPTMYSGDYKLKLLRLLDFVGAALMINKQSRLIDLRLVTCVSWLSLLQVVFLVAEMPAEFLRSLHVETTVTSTAITEKKLKTC